MNSIECAVEESVYEYMIYDEYGVGVIAYARVVRNDRYVEIKVINVSREHRHKGIGTVLLARIVDDHSDHTIIVETFEYLVDWYKKFDFEVVSDKPLVMLRRPSRASGGAASTPAHQPPA
ncbi:MAG: GNAT family N-acetyltransferase [Candidatus Jordarchaeales archaeon]